MLENIVNGAWIGLEKWVFSVCILKKKKYFLKKILKWALLRFRTPHSLLRKVRSSWPKKGNKFIWVTYLISFPFLS